MILLKGTSNSLCFVQKGGGCCKPLKASYESIPEKNTEWKDLVGIFGKAVIF